MSEPRKFWMRWRVRAGYPVAVIYWLLSAPSMRSILIGGGVAVVGVLIRAAAAGHLRKDQELAISGPYAYTRNPLYFGSAFLAGGFAIAGRSWPAGLLVVAYFAVFYYAVMRNEESDLRKRFGTAFESYAAKVPLFFPRVTSAAGDGAPFSWALYRRNREFRAVIGTAGGLAVVWLRMWLRQRYGY